jgi:MFS family permease
MKNMYFQFSRLILKILVIYLCAADMPFKILPRTEKFRRIGFVTPFFLLVNAFSWYFMSYLTVDGIVQELSECSLKALCLKISYPLSIIISAILGSILLKNVCKPRFFYTWTFFGLASSASLAILSRYSFEVDIFVVTFMGGSLGFGMPSLLSYFTEVTTAENRGSIGGLTLFATSISIVIFTAVKPMLNQILATSFITCWRGWGLVALRGADMHKIKQELQKPPSHHSTKFIRNRTFLLYLLAWFMFACVDGFGANIVILHGRNFHDSFKFVEPFVVSLSTLVSGILSDMIGRKRIMTLGFVSLGTAYAILGLTPEAWFSWLLFFVVSGFAIGSLWLLFTVIIWGEISEQQIIEKYYAIGEAPYFLAGIVSIVFAPVASLIPKTSAFSLAALFLFLAVIPLMFAPETLPEKTLRERELRNYIEKAKRIREKFTKD